MTAMLVREPEAEFAAWIALPVSVNEPIKTAVKNVETAFDDDDDDNEIKFVDHIFTSLDTLPMLALKYGTSSCEIKRVNRITTLDFMEEGTVLRVPTNRYLASTEEIQNGAPPNITTQMANDFAAVTGCPREEAVYYLSSNDWNIGAALQERRDDMLWEEQQSSSRRK
eukprot:TRINITY_DN1572_c2_g1_i1.p1 TRINITY_DN1572_c2_g1~~TRINITY_DN1572_c2_g1_i1.p1  ORF type:complete len:180 (+),score=39.94 TRINITY_DN1572_c2_g1_i1:37-540(+)